MVSLDEFVFDCVNDYEEKMDSIFHSAKSIAELQYAHHDHKSTILKLVPGKWTTCFGARELPQNVKKSVTEKIDQTYEQLKKHFLSDKKPPPPAAAPNAEGKVQVHEEGALNFYTQQMDTFFEENPSPSKKELSLEHKKASKEAIAIAMKRGASGKEGAHILTQLAFSIEARYKEFVRKCKEAADNKPIVSDIAIGIDLGTTNCCVMLVNNGKLELVRNKKQGDLSTTPSYVTFHEDGSDTFGLVAKERAFKFPEVTIYDAKRMIGRPYEDPNLQKDKESWPFEVINDNGNPKVITWGRGRYPHEISARLLAQFRVMAEEHLQLARGTIRKAVITVPAYFTEPQRRATNEAAECAGLQVLNILSEPTAAAIAYSYERRTEGNRTALIYDLGGGTFDVAIAKVSDSDVTILGVDGDTHLGGQDFDQLLMDHCIDEFRKAEDFDLKVGRDIPQKLVRDDVLRALSRVKLQCERAKEQLAVANTANICVEGIVGAKTLDVNITRVKLEELVRPLVQKTLDIVDRALNEAKNKGIKGKEDIDDVILVGGSTRLILVEKMLGEYFGGKQLCKHINPDEAVAYGAAIQAAILTNALVGAQANEKLPIIKVQDVLPLSLGLEVIGEKFSPILKKNCNIPCKHMELYVTVVDNQTSIKVKVYQGESAKSTDNNWLGEFLIEGLPPGPAGQEKIEVTMSIDSMGILQVDAMSVSMGNRESISITSDRLGMDMATMEQLTKKLENLCPPKPKPRAIVK